MSLAEKLKKFFFNYAVPEYLAPKGSVLYWQELVLFWVLSLILTLGFFLIVPVSLSYFIKGAFLDGFISIIILFLVILVLIFRRHIKYPVRAGIMALGGLLLILFRLFVDKNILVGMAALYGLSVFISVLHKKAGKYIVIILNAIICSVWGWLLYEGYYKEYFPDPLTAENSLRYAFSVYIIGIIAIIPVAILIESLLYFSGEQKKMSELRSNEVRLLVEAQKNLKRVNDELDEFTYAASHDMQEPLRMITSYTQLIKKKNQNKLDEKSVQYLNYALENSVRMQRIIDDMLDYARYNKNKDILKTIDTTEVLNEIVENFKAPIKKNKAQIKYDSLPKITANREQLFRLFQNLIENALKFCKKDESPIIHINAEKKENEIIFSIKDNGIGIEQKYFDKIFMAFKRLHKKEEYPGSGVGLSQCKKIVEMHNGRIWVESIPKEGSTFYFSIPTSAPEAA
ncbi:MAG: ATP-binding protein [Spirochaetia bacterium]|nr:ATP-binding protein [Spirochaetia bacterium]